MTDAMLRLARAVYPSQEWVTDDVSVVWYNRPDDFGTFDPANNADQFCDVLAWLLGYKPGIVIDVDAVYTLDQDGFIDVIYAHVERKDASGIRRAVVEAACRCL